jgi:hypothetical protein
MSPDQEPPPIPHQPAPEGNGTAKEISRARTKDTAKHLELISQYPLKKVEDTTSPNNLIISCHWTLF